MQQTANMNGSWVSTTHSAGDLSVSTESAFCQLLAVWQMKIILGKCKGNWSDKSYYKHGQIDYHGELMSGHWLVPLACWSAFPRLKLFGDFFFFFS